MVLGILTVFGLCLFEIISSVDNAIINAEVLSTMGLMLVLIDLGFANKKNSAIR